MGTGFFLLSHITADSFMQGFCFHWDILVICHVIVLKLNTTVFTSLHFWSLWPHLLNFFDHLKKRSMTKKMTPGSMQGSNTFSKKHFPKFFNTFSILNEKTLIPSLIFIIPKFYSWNTMQKNIGKTVINSKEQNLDKQMEFPYWIWNFLTFQILYVLLWSKSLSGECAKLHTVAASNNNHIPWSPYYCLFAPRIDQRWSRSRSGLWPEFAF